MVKISFSFDSKEEKNKKTDDLLRRGFSAFSPTAEKQKVEKKVSRTEDNLIARGRDLTAAPSWPHLAAAERVLGAMRSFFLLEFLFCVTWRETAQNEELWRWLAPPLDGCGRCGLWKTGLTARSFQQEVSAVWSRREINIAHQDSLT